MEPVTDAPGELVIPTLNEAEAIGPVIREIPRGLAADIIVADSGSDRRHAGRRPGRRRAGDRRRPRLRPRLRARRGRGRPGSRVIVFLDGDGADRGDLIDAIAGPVLAGTHDFVLASRTRGAREPGSMLWHQVLAGLARRPRHRPALYGISLQRHVRLPRHRPAGAGAPRRCGR